MNNKDNVMTYTSFRHMFLAMESMAIRPSRTLENLPTGNDEQHTIERHGDASGPALLKENFGL